MSDKSILPSWLSRGIDEYFPIKGIDQTFPEIINDAKKNNKKFKNIDEDLNNKILNLDRQFLHAKQLGFDHPRTEERLEFSSNIPKELSDILKKLRKLSK